MNNIDIQKQLWINMVEDMFPTKDDVLFVEMVLTFNDNYEMITLNELEKG